jgi:hypothetical protein
LLIALVIILGLLVAADRIGNYVAERAAADNLQSSQDLPSRPDVSIAGFPFLTQLASRDFDEITVTAHDVPIGQSRRLDLSQLHVVLHTLTVSRNFSTVHANRADATATISFASLSSALGADVRYAGNGRVAATKSVTVAGHTISAKVTAQPKLINGALAFTQTHVNDADRIGATVASVLSRIFDLDVPLQGIPFHVRVTSLNATQDGIHVALTGQDLSYSK